MSGASKFFSNWYNFALRDETKTLARLAIGTFCTSKNMDKNFKIFPYSFQGSYEEENRDQLFADLFHSEEVLKDLGCVSIINSKSKSKKIISMEIETVPCTLLSTDIFDRIYDRGIVLQDGTIRKCFEEYVNDIVIADELRNMLLMEESDNYYLYEEMERKEFLFRIFQHFCLGGSLNQYEDNIEPYFLMAKTLYKDLICVRKTGTQKKITIMSKVYKVTVFELFTQEILGGLALSKLSLWIDLPRTPVW
ncbi:cilia- and flagella-associated protein 300 [Trichonephila clavata]|uniref:Cilia- and flagella-associated protein 300 n=1 Tax=Trichonephila clavata TaxID=2740835 RepID=A0A8X6FU18_TRICU|nr:cilia- and flagella-associated protein 300 [Trichonephila clavata]